MSFWNAWITDKNHGWIIRWCHKHCESLANVFIAWELLQAWHNTHTTVIPSSSPQCVPLPSFYFSFLLLLVGILEHVHTFSRLPFCFQRNPFRLGREKKSVGDFSSGVSYKAFCLSVCVGSDLWPFFKLPTGHRPSSPHAKTNGFSRKLNVTLALCMLLFSFVIWVVLILDMKDNFSFSFFN